MPKGEYFVAAGFISGAKTTNLFTNDFVEHLLFVWLKQLKPCGQVSASKPLLWDSWYLVRFHLCCPPQTERRLLNVQSMQMGFFSKNVTAHNPWR